ncbi:glycosyltransferase family 2 protein [Pseudoprimorskyibacter insulae]|uniref:Glycosyltransferase 2-like domain-containing protein n=1 Tax=Pseudoprimorskyibacter insulae TaxID=1695997 RepID=A0A2R8AP27_9RHOB|nr:glycosyltransferase family 2 protein [Pseudoprimorskyibacter insulae]SPF77816.1 hypothetical protein PRI8871_00402 [Pseudoprimorskyibacter insulae]
MTIALASCMRNEGIFVLEWLAYHLGLGFDRVIVVTNDCTDGSDDLLDALQAEGLITHIRQTVPAGTPAQDAGMDHVLRLCRDDGIGHVLHIDSDEFLYLNDSLNDLLARTRDADCVPIPWRAFGDSGVAHWSPGDMVIERNTRAERAPVPGETKFKCLFKAASFARATDHNPLEPLVDAPRVMSPDGAELYNHTLYHPKSARFRPHHPAARAKSAQIYHYAVRSADCFLMKNDRGDGQGKSDSKYHLGSHWYRAANRNDVTVTRLSSQAGAVLRRMTDWRMIPAIAKAEATCHDWFTARRAALLTPERIEAWTVAGGAR